MAKVFGFGRSETSGSRLVVFDTAAPRDVHAVPLTVGGTAFPTDVAPTGAAVVSGVLYATTAKDGETLARLYRLTLTSDSSQDGGFTYSSESLGNVPSISGQTLSGDATYLYATAETAGLSKLYRIDPADPLLGVATNPVELGGPGCRCSLQSHGTRLPRWITDPPRARRGHTGVVPHFDVIPAVWTEFIGAVPSGFFGSLASIEGVLYGFAESIGYTIALSAPPAFTITRPQRPHLGAAVVHDGWLYYQHASTLEGGINRTVYRIPVGNLDNAVPFLTGTPPPSATMAITAMALQATAPVSSP